MKKPRKSLLDLIKDRLQEDFRGDRFDPPVWKGTPATHKPAQIRKRTSTKTVSEENKYHITPDDFRGYQLKLMPPPFYSDQFEAKTVYIDYKEDQLICTVCDSDRYISRSTINVADLRNLGAKIDIPLRLYDMEPLIPTLLIIHKFDRIKSERDFLADKTDDKKQESYLQKFIDGIKEQLNSERSNINQLKTYASLSETLKRKFEEIEKELSDILNLTTNSNATEISKSLIGNKTNNRTQIDINTAVVNMLSDEVKRLTDSVADFEQDVYDLLKKTQLNPPVDSSPKPPPWTQRTAPPNESPEIDQGAEPIKPSTSK